MNLWAAGTHVARAVLGNIGAGLSPFPYALIYPQDEHERLLIERLGRGRRGRRARDGAGGDSRRWRVACAPIERPDGAIETCAAATLRAATARIPPCERRWRLDFQADYEHLFYVADVAASGTAMNGELHVALDTSDFLAVFPLKEDGRARLIGTVRADAEHHRENLSWDDVS